jgi:hypothetical protein
LLGPMLRCWKCFRRKYWEKKMVILTVI